MSDNSPFHTVGNRYHQFVVTKSLEIPELQCRLIELIHEPSNAHIMHIANDDPENVFCLSFRTLPSNSNGVAHILEHTVLCGSKKFPVKDPFFAMQSRSLNTFMNAFTGSDYTCYPAATQEKQDFYNLLDVYLDAVFHPYIKELSFLQEGHRVEFATADDPTTPLIFKGVVFNEMKGAMASSTTRLSEIMNKALYPDITYGFNSGGDPADIPSLSYAELCEFHRTFYHPSRCLYYFYGNLPLEEHLNFIASRVLNDIDKVPEIPPLPRQTRYEKPQYLQGTYPASEEDSVGDKAIVSFGWLTCHILDQEELLALSLLEIILMDTDASPLKKAFLKSGLCTQANSYMDPDISEIPIIFVLKGCDPDKADLLENVLKDTLSEIVYQGIPYYLVENAMHQLEFHRSEITGDHAPFGLSLFMRSALPKQHGANPEDGLMVHSLFHMIHKQILADPHCLTRLISKYFLENTHFVRVVMTPDPGLAAKESETEKALLEKMKASLTQEQAQKIVDQAAELKEFQKAQEEEDLDVLPKISLEDVAHDPRQYALDNEQVGNIHVFHHTCFTNEIVYADLVFELPDIKETELPYLRLFSSLFSQMGSGNRDYSANLEYIQAHTGGIGAGLSLNYQTDDSNDIHPLFHLKGKALHHKASKLFPLLIDAVTDPQFNDIVRLKEIILKQYTALQTSVNQSALRYALNLSASPLSASTHILNAWYGLDYFYSMKELALNFEKHADGLLACLQSLRERILCVENAHLVVSSDANFYDEMKLHNLYGMQNLPFKASQPWRGHFNPVPIVPQGRVIASPIAFIGKVFNTIPYSHPDSAALNLAAFLFDNLVLHTRLREQGGAYGGGAACNTMAGTFYFYSYRDPNISRSLQAFEDAIAEVVAGKFDSDDLEEAKIEMVQGLDTPIAPGSRADVAYSWLRENKTYEMRKNFRTKILNLTAEEVIQAVQNHIVPNFAKGVPVVFAGKELLERENALLNGLLKIEQI